MLSKKRICIAASEGWKVISQSDTQTHTASLVDGWGVRVTRIYSHRAFRTSWRPLYDLIAPDGQTPIAGYDNAESFARYVAFNFERVKTTFLTGERK